MGDFLDCFVCKQLALEVKHFFELVTEEERRTCLNKLNLGLVQVNLAILHIHHCVEPNFVSYWRCQFSIILFVFLDSAAFASAAQIIVSQ